MHFINQTILFSVPVAHIEAVQGGTARLPCNVTPPVDDDKITLVIWYKDGLTSPIHRYVTNHHTSTHPSRSPNPNKPGSVVERTDSKQKSKFIYSTSYRIYFNYSFDARKSTIENGTHWFDQTLLNGRGRFDARARPAMFAIDAVRITDTGLYRCRVDYQKTPTRNSKVNLTIIGK